ncbi:hypothetical protein E8E14_010468 [Neopestalotiopsis sp. 37M]|nr:hypothetical protein E8E14_010468 [Neopestalotiopsis sp. 37M]
MSTRPSKNHFRGIFFPEGEADSYEPENHFRAIMSCNSEVKPQLVWIDCSARDENGRFRNQDPGVDAFLGRDGQVLSHLVKKDVLLQRLLPHPIRLYYGGECLDGRSRLNKSVATVLATLPGWPHEWCGPIVAVGRHKKNSAVYRDLFYDDFRYLVDHLISCDRWAFTLPDIPSDSGVVRGVIINCLGARNDFNAPHFEPVDVPCHDPIFSTNASWTTTSIIADRIGLPILTRRLPITLRQARKGFDAQNQEVMFLHLCCVPNKRPSSSGKGWGWADWKWQYEVGNVLVVRRDKKPLAPFDVEALCRYCKDEVMPIIRRSMQEYTQDMSSEDALTRSLVLSMICRPMFSIFWAKLRDKKREEGNIVESPYPYDV